MDSGLPFGTGAPSRQTIRLRLPRWHWHTLSETRQRRLTDAVICSKNAPDSWLIGIATAADPPNPQRSFPSNRARAEVRALPMPSLSRHRPARRELRQARQVCFAFVNSRSSVAIEPLETSAHDEAGMKRTTQIYLAARIWVCQEPWHVAI